MAMPGDRERQRRAKVEFRPPVNAGADAVLARHWDTSVN